MRKSLSWLLAMPLAIPAYILATVYGNIFEFAGPVQTFIRELTALHKGQYWFPDIRSTQGAIFVIGLSTTPYVYLLSRIGFQMQPAEWFEAAQNLGKSKREMFWLLALPALRPFLVTGVALAIMETMADLGAVQILGVTTLSTSIYRTWFFLNEPILAAKLASILLLLAALAMFLEKVSRGSGLYHAQRGATPRPLKTLKKSKALIISLCCSLPVFFGFLLPIFWLIRLTFYRATPLSLEHIFNYTLDSMTLSGLAAIFVVISALIIVFAERAHKGMFKYINLLANLGYAVPGMVIAVGLLILQSIISKYLNVSVLISGTIAGLMIAYLVRFIATAYSPIHSGYQRLNEEMDMAAISLGKNKWQLLWSVHLPMLKWPLMTAVIMVAIDVLKELPATLIIRPYNVKTLAMAVYDFASDDRTADAAPYALILVSVASIAVWFLQRLQWRQT